MKFISLRMGALALVGVAVLATILTLPAAAAAPDESRGLTVVGSGAVRAVPDLAEWSFGVQTDAATAGVALSQNSAEMEKLLEALKAAGIRSEDLRTEQVSVFPRTSEDGRAVAGFTASNTVHATIRDIAQAGSIVDAAAAAGANQIFGPTLKIADDEELYEQALERAYDRAVEKATRLAAKTGVTLGRPLSIVESASGAIVVADEAAAFAEPPIELGQQRIEATVTVTFAIS